MTKEELAKHDGRGGNKAYVAVNGHIYDFSDSKLWQEGDHQGAHQAGRDLTEELKSAPHVRAVIERFPVVGKLEETAVTPESKGGGKIFMILFAIAILIAIIAMLI